MLNAYTVFARRLSFRRQLKPITITESRRIECMLNFFFRVDECSASCSESTWQRDAFSNEINFSQMVLFTPVQLYLSADASPHLRA